MRQVVKAGLQCQLGQHAVTLQHDSPRAGDDHVVGDDRLQRPGHCPPNGDPVAHDGFRLEPLLRPVPQKDV